MNESPDKGSSHEMNSSHDDRVRRIHARDVQALAEFIEDKRLALMAFIQRELGAGLRRKVEPEDIFQEASADAVRSLPTTELGDRDPFSWLCQIAERRIIDAHRRFFGAQKRDAGREVAFDARGSDDSHSPLVNLLAASMTTPSQAFSRNAREMRVADALNQLPEDQREVVRLRYVENLPSKEIAERVGKSDGAVRVMLTRTLAKLQKILEEG